MRGKGGGGLDFHLLLMQMLQPDKVFLHIIKQHSLNIHSRPIRPKIKFAYKRLLPTLHPKPSNGLHTETRVRTDSLYPKRLFHTKCSNEHKNAKYS